MRSLRLSIVFAGSGALAVTTFPSPDPLRRMSYVTVAQFNELSDGVVKLAAGVEKLTTTDVPNALLHADMAWMLASTALVQIMLPGLAFFCTWLRARGRPAQHFQPRPLPPSHRLGPRG